jgi:hypothetical protein
MEKERHKDNSTDEIEVTPAMIEAGADVIVSCPGVGECGIWFPVRELAEKVFLAMVHARASRQHP